MHQHCRVTASTFCTTFQKMNRLLAMACSALGVRVDDSQCLSRQPLRPSSQCRATPCDPEWPTSPRGLRAAKQHCGASRRRRRGAAGRRVGTGVDQAGMEKHGPIRVFVNVHTGDHRPVFTGNIVSRTKYEHHVLPGIQPRARAPRCKQELRATSQDPACGGRRGERWIPLSP